MIEEKDGLFVLSTKHTTYAFQIEPTGQARQLYYGKRIRLTPQGAKALAPKESFGHGNMVAYSQETKNITLETMRTEWSGLGKGDVRESFVELTLGDGSQTTDFIYYRHEITKGKREDSVLPGSYDEDYETDHLCLILKERHRPVTMELHYYVYEACDCITRTAKIINTGMEQIFVRRLCSMQLDLPQGDYAMTQFQGTWIREMEKSTIPLRAGIHMGESLCGVSSSRCNPFFMIHHPMTNESQGSCMGFHLIYSGNHMELAQKDSFGGVRVLTGISPNGLAMPLKQGECFEAPEAVMSFSAEGFGALSAHFHEFIREHIVRGVWKKKARPILLNSWEATYFKVNEKNLCKLAKAAKEVGIELFVMDDGWFGQRDNDEKGLGDWVENREKLPGGVKGLCDKINSLGLDFGIWVEPEMVNVDSELYGAHPDWTLEIPERDHSEGRNQRILNLGLSEVQEYLIDQLTRLFSSANISYVKWDMNRIVSDVYDRQCQDGMQGNVIYRYYVGLYRVMGELIQRFPEILFEGCASGGNRFDLGMLCYFPQIWASDNTDAICRSQIQENYSYGYPQSVFTAHVSAAPNHQTLRRTPLETRFAVAALGVLGYECNLVDVSSGEREAIREQIRLYKEWREVLQFGQLYRDSTADGQKCFTIVSPDRERAVGVMVQSLAVANPLATVYKAKGLAMDKEYHFYNRKLKYDIRLMGDLVNTISPIHISQDSVMHRLVAKLVQLEGETEDYLLTGEELMEAGVSLCQNFSAVGWQEQVRIYPDFSARMYFIEETV